MAFFELNDVFGYQDANDIKKLWADSTAPAEPGTDEVWLDTSAAPYQLKRYNGTDWDIVAGGITVTSTGEVGIGTTTPSNSIHVSTDNTTNASICLERSDGATATVAAANSGVNIGSQTDHEVRFLQNGVIKMVIDTNSQVGIGTTTPSYPIHVSTDNTTNASILLERDGGSTAIVTGGNSGVNIGSQTDNPVRFVANGDTKMVIESNGNVGIGTATPAYSMELVRSSGNAQIAATLTGGASVILSGTSSAGFVGTMSNHELRITVNNDTKMTLDTNGKVGIGTTTPGAELDIKKDGSINLGASSDLVIQHDGTDTYIKNDVDNGADLYIQNKSHGEKIIMNCEDSSGTEKDMLTLDPEKPIVKAAGSFVSESYNQTLEVNEVLVTNIRHKSTGILMIQITPEELGALIAVSTKGFQDLKLIAGCYSTSQWSTTIDTASRINVYFDANSLINIQNKRSGARTLSVGFYGCRFDG
ncbi:MAG: hypothetical protein GY940_33950 [bacterium]|nr:hypothetical protein [bacterium]